MTGLLAGIEFDAWPGRLTRRLRRRRNSHCVNVLTYHSIARKDNIFTRGTDLRHPPARFERQLDWLAARYNPISLRALVTAVERGEQPHRAVVITFDDGYADSLRWAVPIMYRRRIPMTVFPVTSVLGNTDLIWQHKLVWLEANGHGQKVADAFEVSGFPPRVAGESLSHFARRCYRPDLTELLEEVLRTTGRSGARLAAALRPYLEPEEIAEADPDFVDFGNHTHTHPILSALTRRQQRGEIVVARDALVALTGRPPIALAYPFGLKRHYDVESKELARETGHRAALDLRRRLNVGRIDPFELSRKPAPCGSRIGFEKMLEDWPANARLSGPMEADEGGR